MIDTVFEDINDVYLKILQEIYDNGQLKGKRKEVPFITFTLTNLDKNILFFPFSQRNWPWILRECSDRLIGIKNPGLSFNYSKNWENRIEESGLYSYHYSDRMNGQMNKLLGNKLHSRDKIVHVWEREDYNSKSRQPCTIIMQPLIEYDNKLSMVVYMRNNDIVNIFPSDIFIHSTYLKYWAIKKKLQYGNIYWVAAIAYYQKKRDKIKFVERLLDQWELNYEKASIQPTAWDNNILEDLVEKEKFEQQFIINDSTLKKEPFFKTDYVKEWFWLMKLYHFRKAKDKESFDAITNSVWTTEFKLIKDSILSPK